MATPVSLEGRGRKWWLGTKCQESKQPDEGRQEEKRRQEAVPFGSYRQEEAKGQETTVEDKLLQVLVGAPNPYIYGFGDSVVIEKYNTQQSCFFIVFLQWKAGQTTFANL